MMKEMSEQHDQAMAIADDADLAKGRGDSAESLRLYRAAFELERKVADATANDLNLEPTRSIVHRSAASLAFQIKEYRECEQLVCRALAGNPSAEIADELRQLWEQCSFSMHLRKQDFDLADNSLMVSMWGQAVGYGFASCAEVVERLNSTQKLLYRTVERIAKQPYREQGDVPRIIRDNFHVWASVAKAASYAFVLRVGGRESQNLLFDFHHATQVIDEVMICMELVGENKYGAVEKRFGNKAYFRNFIGLTRQIAPRGALVSNVGFASQSHNKVREVVIVQPKMRRAGSSSLFGTNPTFDREQIRIDGVLLYADSLNRGHRIQVQDAQGIEHAFVVPKGLMADVVRPYYEKNVTVYGVRRHQVNTLESIVPFDETSKLKG